MRKLYWEKVYVTGRVISTGNGKITALDGAANIKIDNNTSTALKVGSINNKDVAGIISINDTQKNTITEYYRDKTITKTLTDKKDSNGNYIYNVKEETIDGKTRYYTPDEGMRYNWTEGSTTGTETTYTQWWPENVGSWDSDHGSLPGLPLRSGWDICQYQATPYSGFFWRSTAKCHL